MIKPIGCLTWIQVCTNIPLLRVLVFSMGKATKHHIPFLVIILGLFPRNCSVKTGIGSTVREQGVVGWRRLKRGDLKCSKEGENGDQIEKNRVEPTQEQEEVKRSITWGRRQRPMGNENCASILESVIHTREEKKCCSIWVFPPCFQLIGGSVKVHVQIWIHRLM